MKRFFGSVVLALALFLPALPAPAQAAACQFVLGFQTLHNLIPSIVGSCLENEHFNPQNGDSLQATTNGLLVWRKADNWTAFTDGYHTWVNGPFGVQERLNSQRFSWEANPQGLPVVGAMSNVGQCTTADLSVGIGPVDAGAGNFFQTVLLTNTSSHTCTLFGFPGLQMLDAQGQPLPTKVQWGGDQLTTEPGPQTVTLPPGAVSSFKVHWEDVPVGNETTCPTSAMVEITPPNAFNFLLAPLHFTACGGGQLTASAVRPGTG